MCLFLTILYIFQLSFYFYYILYHVFSFDQQCQYSYKKSEVPDYFELTEQLGRLFYSEFQIQTHNLKVMIEHELSLDGLIYKTAQLTTIMKVKQMLEWLKYIVHSHQQQLNNKHLTEDVYTHLVCESTIAHQGNLETCMDPESEKNKLREG